MLFNSIQFLCFFPAVTAIYYILPHRFRYILLLIASYGFYMCWNTRYALLMLCSTLITYRSGIALEKAVDTPPPHHHRRTHRLPASGKEDELFFLVSF